MFRTIVVPLDHTGRAETAVPHAIALARQSGATLRLVTVRPPYADTAAVSTHLADVAERHGIRADLVVDAPGNVAAVVTEMAADPGTLLCLATHARRPVTQLVLGSVSEKVVRASRQPVLLIGPHCAPPPDRYDSMVVALDGSPLAERILPTVANWSTHLDMVPRLFQVLPPHVIDDIDADRDPDVIETGYLQALAADLRDRGAKAEWDNVHDRAVASAIVGFADEQARPLIAITTHGRSGLARVALGSVALRVALHTHSPVLVLRPSPGPAGTAR
jgi:nucleotide-binding universal stress UspA family protein